VAVEFGVSGMALYRYVPGKAELIELMVEAVLHERPDLSAAGPGWRAQLVEWAQRMLAIYRSHPWALAATAMRRQVMGPRQLAWMEVALAALEQTTLDAAQRHHVFILIASHVRGIAQQFVDFDEERDHEWDRLTGELLDRHADRFPALTRTIAEGGFARSDADPLAFGMARILDGVQALIDGR
jgi:AcrR family transcriptional regulator